MYTLYLEGGAATLSKKGVTSSLVNGDRNGANGLHSSNRLIRSNKNFQGRNLPNPRWTAPHTQLFY